MKAIKFKGYNAEYAKDQDEYQTLPMYRYENDPQGELVCCWELSLWEKIKMMFTGRVWLHVLTFHKPLQPVYLSINKPKFDE